METYDNFKYIRTNLEMSFFFQNKFSIKISKNVLNHFIKHLHKIHSFSKNFDEYFTNAKMK